MKYILEQALKLKKTYNSVAIITKNQTEADLYKAVVQEMKKAPYVKIVNKRDKAYLVDRVMVIPSYLSKGLEFDAVLVSNANEQNYSIKERNLLYVVCTRALHKLNIYYTDKISPLITNR